jgi:hypothetical protein
MTGTHHDRPRGTPRWLKAGVYAGVCDCPDTPERHDLSLEALWEHERRCSAWTTRPTNDCEAVERDFRGWVADEVVPTGEDEAFTHRFRAVRAVEYLLRLKTAPVLRPSSRHKVYSSGERDAVRVVVFGQILHPLVVLALRALYARSLRERIGMDIEFRSLPVHMLRGVVVPAHWTISHEDARALAMADRWLHASRGVHPTCARKFFLMAIHDPGRLHRAMKGKFREGDSKEELLRDLGGAPGLIEHVLAMGGYYEGAVFRSPGADAEAHGDLHHALGLTAWPAVVVNGVEIDPLDIEGPLFDDPSVLQGHGSSPS